MKENELIRELKKKKIPFELHEGDENRNTRILFLRDEEKNYYLLTVPADARISLKALGLILDCGPLTAVKKRETKRVLGIPAEDLTPLSVLEKEGNPVHVLLDNSLEEKETGVYSLESGEILCMQGKDLAKYLKAKGKDMRKISVRQIL